MFNNIKQEIAIRLIEKEYNCPHLATPFPESMKHAAPLHFQKCQQNWNTNIARLLSHSPIKQATAIYLFYVFIHPAFPVSSPPHYMSVFTKMPHIHFLNDAIYATPNPFFSPSIQKEFERMACKLQSAYYSFCKLARLWKLRHYNVQQTVDFYMNELLPASKYTYQLIQNRHVFYFSLTDLKQIVLTAITATSEFFSVPAIIKNPYNGVPLTKADIYNIYFKMRNVLFKMPRLFVAFYECEFNINEFKRKHECAILEHVVEQYIKMSTVKTIMPETMRMIRAHDRTNIICLKDEEKIKKLVDFMRYPYLSLHLFKKYTFDNTKRHNLGIELAWRIKRFLSFYANVGGESAFFDMISLSKTRENMKKSLEKTHVNYEWMNNHKYEDVAYNMYVHCGGFNVAQPEPMAFRPRSYGAAFREDIDREQAGMRIVWRPARPVSSSAVEPARVRRLLEFDSSGLDEPPEPEVLRQLPTPMMHDLSTHIQREIRILDSEINHIIIREYEYLGESDGDGEDEADSSMTESDSSGDDYYDDDDDGENGD